MSQKLTIKDLTAPDAIGGLMILPGVSLRVVDHSDMSRTIKITSDH